MFFKNRVLPAAGIVLVTFGCVLSGRESRMLYFAALALASVYELYVVFKQHGLRYLYAIPAAYILGQLVLVWSAAEPVWYVVWFALMSFAALFKLVLTPGLDGKSALWTIFTMLWPFFFYGIVLVLAGEERAGVLLTLGILSTWACDSMALGVGRAMGRHKLAPTVSPNKTWEGAIGGALFSVVAGVLLYFILKPFGGPGLICCMVTALLSSSFGQVGDLVASWVKRLCGVKDYSRLLGEHGGILDKMDSMLFSLPVAWLCVRLFGGM